MSWNPSPSNVFWAVGKTISYLGCICSINTSFSSKQTAILPFLDPGNCFQIKLTLAACYFAAYCLQRQLKKRWTWSTPESSGMKGSTMCQRCAFKEQTFLNDCYSTRLACVEFLAAWATLAKLAAWPVFVGLILTTGGTCQCSLSNCNFQSLLAQKWQDYY